MRRTDNDVNISAKEKDFFVLFIALFASHFNYLVRKRPLTVSLIMSFVIHQSRIVKFQ